jgi:hypothetical protein
LSVIGTSRWGVPDKSLGTEKVYESVRLLVRGAGRLTAEQISTKKHFGKKRLRFFVFVLDVENCLDVFMIL